MALVHLKMVESHVMGKFLCSKGAHPAECLQPFAGQFETELDEGPAVIKEPLKRKSETRGSRTREEEDNSCLSHFSKMKKPSKTATGMQRFLVLLSSLGQDLRSLPYLKDATPEIFDAGPHTPESVTQNAQLRTQNRIQNHLSCVRK